MNRRVSKPIWSNVAAGCLGLLSSYCTSEAPVPASTSGALPVSPSDAAGTPEGTGEAPPGEPPEEPAPVSSAPVVEGNPPLDGNLASPDPAAPDSPAEPPAEPPPAGFSGSFILGADISSVQEAADWGSVFVDTDGVEKSMVELLKSHGFNYVRLRTFVDPAAAYGYTSGDGCEAKMQPYNDRDHTIDFAREVKAASMGLLLDFHYSDTWADPGKQVIPEAWRDATSVAELALRVEEYTLDVLNAMVAAGVKPDMVQVGNEITPGMLIHVPTEQTDCYGNGSVLNPVVNGSIASWDNLATLLRAGIGAVRQVDPAIQVMLHLENLESAEGVANWVSNAQARGVSFDVLGLSAYEQYQGPSSAWRGTLQTLAAQLPELSFAIAEYNPQRRLLNDLMRELPDGRGLGTFLWEPTQSGPWGEGLFDWQGNRATARASDFAEYDQMRADYSL